jgi:hypothetical protein
MDIARLLHDSFHNHVMVVSRKKLSPMQLLNLDISNTGARAQTAISAASPAILTTQQRCCGLAATVSHRL